MYCIHILCSTPYLIGTTVPPRRATEFRFGLPHFQKKKKKDSKGRNLSTLQPPPSAPNSSYSFIKREERDLPAATEAAA